MLFAGFMLLLAFFPNVNIKKKLSCHVENIWECLFFNSQAIDSILTNAYNAGLDEGQLHVKQTQLFLYEAT